MRRTYKLRWLRRWCLLGCLAVWLTGSHCVLAQIKTAGLPTDESELIEGLRSRRLFDLAQLHCRRLLESPSLTPTEQASLTIELIKTQTARAILSSGPERESAWQDAEESASDFLSHNPDHPRKFLVQIQSALSHLSNGQLLLQELSAEMVPESAREQAIQELRRARAELSDVQRGIDNEIPEQRGRTLTEDELSIPELLTLNNNVRFQLAIANLNRAMLYTDEDRLNRIDALNNVLRGSMKFRHKLLRANRYGGKSGRCRSSAFGCWAKT